MAKRKLFQPHFDDVLFKAHLFVGFNGRNSVIVNQDKIKAGLAYAVVPLKKDKNGNTHYYAAPLLTRNVSENNVELDENIDIKSN